MRILFVYPPFCTPASPPYTIAKIYAAAKDFLDDHGIEEDKTIGILDLNAKFYSDNYQEYKKEFIRFTEKPDESIVEYDIASKEFREKANKEYSSINHQIVELSKDDDFSGIEQIRYSLDKIKEKEPTLVAFSVIYSSQAIFTYALVRELEKIGIKTVVGGPAVSEKLAMASRFMENYESFLEEISKEMKLEYRKKEAIPNFSIFNDEDYFTRHLVIPLKTCDSCYYKRCAFCTHHNNDKYKEYPIEDVKETIIRQLDAGHNYFFLIDDAISKKRIIEISNIFLEEKERRKKDIFWMCQLRAQKDCDQEFLTRLKESGLRAVLWGIESGSGRILDLMDKGTDPELNKKVLENSRKAGILNVAFIIFGFPTETKEEFMETIRFLEDNTENIDLVLTTIFGLQRGSKVFENPEKFSIKNITCEKRTLLNDSISFDMSDGTSTKNSEKLRNKFKKTIDKINKYPKEFNFFREHMLIYASRKRE